MNADVDTIFGVFDNYDDAVKAIATLREAGFSERDIAVASKQMSNQFQMVDPHKQHVADKGAVGGAVWGGGIGAVLGLAGATLVPGALPVVAGAEIVSILLGAAAGAAGGAFAGPFLALGMSKRDAENHGRFVSDGKTVLMVRAGDHDRKENARSLMVKHGAYDKSMANSP